MIYHSIIFFKERVVTHISPTNEYFIRKTEVEKDVNEYTNKYKIKSLEISNCDVEKDDCTNSLISYWSWNLDNWM